MAALDAGDYATAERILQDIVARNPKAHNAWLALAVVAMRSGTPDVAVARAQRAVELDKSNAIYLNNLGIAHAELEHADVPNHDQTRLVRHGSGREHLDGDLRPDARSIAEHETDHWTEIKSHNSQTESY